MQQDQQPDQQSSAQYKIPKSLFNHPHEFLRNDEIWNDESLWHNDDLDLPSLPTQMLAPDAPPRIYEQLDKELTSDLDLSRMSTVQLMQFSSAMQSIRTMPLQDEHAAQGGMGAARASLYEQELLGKTLVLNSVTGTIAAVPAKPQPAWQVFLGKPAVKVIIGALVGLAMLFLVFRSINIPRTMGILETSLTTPHGVLYACLAAIACLTSYAIRGARWRLFVSRIGKVSLARAIQIFYTGVFINFALPVQGGEVAKSLMLKRVTGIPVSQSLPTVAMDKSLDLMPALVIMAVVPLIGISMDMTLWIILGAVGGILICVIAVVALTAWNRAAAVKLIQKLLGILPRKFGSKVEGFAMGLVDSLLAAASNPRTFIPAILLTCLAVCCDGLFALFSFWTTGLTQMTFGPALFGYTTFNMFTVLPSPPGGVGSNELYGGIVFSSLLGFNRDHVTAMFLFAHPLFAVVMTITALICLRNLGLTISTITKGRHGNGETKPPPSGAGNRSSVPAFER
ncbi:MAG TPA: lysylphosphatidylglycerol synthase transmembrane domain-containing protein [Ktedonobacteraceae bacterium]|jgi:uncharacterized protein (TIRG00374 family)|nr:lysylphosphatidylglycerol synthase transmembrane domain-containing protein [Ktedonobacteraceae bacterium]